MTVIRWIALILLGTVVLLAAIARVARVSDGPIGPFPGGRFRTGEPASGTGQDLDLLARTPEVEIQLLHPPRSITTHVVVLDDQVYIPSGFVKVGPFVFLGQAFWKRWPTEVARNPQVILRSNGRLYERRAVKVVDPDLNRKLTERMAEKYALEFDQPPDPEKVWFFHLEPRAG